MLRTENTGVSAINENGVIAGGYFDTDANTGQGYIRDASGNFTEFGVEAASISVYGLNESRDVSGTVFYKNSSSGYVRDASGNLTTFTVQDTPTRRGTASTMLAPL